MSRILSTLRDTLFWSYERGTLQYDILCGLILVFIFLTPRQNFRDWPVIDNPQQFRFGEQIVYTLDEEGNPVLNISTQLVPATPDVDRVKTLAQDQLQKTLNRPVSIANIKPIRGENGETIGYSVWLDREGGTAF
jgi:hypothetical protein